MDTAYCGTWDLVGSWLCPQQPQKEEVLMALSNSCEMWVIQNEDPIKVKQPRLGSGTFRKGFHVLGRHSWDAAQSVMTEMGLKPSGIKLARAPWARSKKWSPYRHCNGKLHSSAPRPSCHIMNMGKSGHLWHPS